MVNLEVRRPAHLVPSYSLTGDLLSFLRCHLQYRYYNGSSLPPSRPVQLWYGEFIHGVLESAFRVWQTAAKRPGFPWPCTVTEWRGTPPPRVLHDIGELGDRIELVLRAQAKEPRSRRTRESAYRRAEAAVNQLGPLLFPIIADAEKKVIGTRKIPSQKGVRPLRAELYELHGVIDVVTQLSLGTVATDNPLRKEIERVCPSLPETFEIIADYKGSARPGKGSEYWKQGDWQVQTYAWLRGHQAEGVPIVAGVLLYINELSPGSTDMLEIQRQVKDGDTDVIPEKKSRDDFIVRNWRRGQRSDQLSLEFRLRRAIRVIAVTPSSLAVATSEFDNVVRRIEESIDAEAQSGKIPSAWAANCSDGDTCVACDFRHFCPSPGPSNEQLEPSAPSAP